MVPYLKLILITTVSGILATALFTFLAYLVLAQALARTFGSGLFENELLNLFVTLLNLAALFLCPFICPLVALYFRKLITDATSNTTAQFFIFTIMSTFPIAIFFSAS